MHRSARSVRLPPDVELALVAARAVYVGSPEHEATPSFAGTARPRASATKGDVRLRDQQELLTRWLREAIAAGQIGGDGEAGITDEARLLNRGRGEYMGRQLEEWERPRGLEAER